MIDEIDFDDKWTQGTISGFRKIETSSNNYYDASKPFPFTVGDIYILIRDLKRLIDPKYLTYLDNLAMNHILNINNPHKVSLSTMLTSIIKELYKEWRNADPDNNTGSLEYFIKVLFQNITIASIETMLEGKTMSEVPSVRAVYELLKKHNESVDAHLNLVNSLFMGNEIIEDPSFALNALVGLPSTFTIKRNSTMTFINAKGLLETAPKDTCVIDYQYGESMFSLWGNRTNNFLYSQAFNQSVWEKNSSYISQSSIRKDPTGNDLSLFLFENNTGSPVEHNLCYTVSLIKDTVYTVSCFIRAAGRYCFGFNLGNELFTSVRFNLMEEKIFIPEAADKTEIDGELVSLGLGWYRCSMTFVAPRTESNKIKFCILDIYDGDLVYNGTKISNATDTLYFWNESLGKYVKLTSSDKIEGLDAIGIDIFGAQFEVFNTMTPYILTTTSSASCAATTIHDENIDSWFNHNEGTIYLDILKPLKLLQTTNGDVFNIYKGSNNLAITASYLSSVEGKLNFKIYNSNNAFFSSTWSLTDTINKRRKIAYTYDSESVIIAETLTPPTEKTVSAIVNSDVTSLSFGCDAYNGTFLNGYIQKMSFYPFKCDKDNLNFLVEVDHV